MKKFWICTMLLLCVGVGSWAAEGKEETISSGTYDTGYVLDKETGEETDSTQNKLTIDGGSFKEQVIAGQSEKGKASSNILTMNDAATLQTQQAAAGVSQNAAAQANELTVQGITTASGLAGGWAQQSGQALENKVTLNGTQVESDTTEPKWVRGGQSKTGAAQNNQVNLLNGAVVKTQIAAGLSESGEVSYNTLTVDGGSKLLSGGIVDNAAYGGYSKDGAAHHNQISLLNADEVSVNAYGGYSSASQVSYNLIETQKAQMTGNLYGGYSESGSAASNEVRIGAQSTVKGTVTGGWANTQGAATENKVSVAAGATVDSAAKLYGGYTAQGTATSNALILNTENTGAEAYGGYAVAGEAQGNSLQVTGATSGTKWAGAVAATTATGNSLTIENANLTTAGSFYGGYAGTDAIGNSLYATGSALTGTLYGGYGQSGQAAGNRVVLQGGSVSGDVYGGYAASTATGNYVELNSVAVTGKVYAGYSTDSSQETANNTLVLSGNTTATGGFFGGNGVSSGNSLLLRNYQNSNLTVDSSFDKVTLYGLDSDVTFANEVANGVEVTLYGKPSELSQTLAHTQSGTTLTLNRDTLGAYRYSITGTPSGSLVDWSVQGRYDQQLAKPYAQAQLAGLALTGLGDDMLEDVFAESRKEKTDHDMFAGVRYYDNTYQTGSHFDMQSIGVQAGHWFRRAENVWGWFAQYAHGHYSTDPTDATGGIDSLGVGGFALLPYSDEGYFEAVLRAGYQSQDFNSDDLSSNLKSKHFYGHASAGLVQKVSALQFYGRVRGSYLLGDKVTDNLGQSVKFQDTQSLQGQIGARWYLGTLARRYQPYIGAAGTYEWLADSQVKVDGHKVTGTDLKGLSGRAEAGISYENNDAMMPLKSVLSVFGQAGQVRGWGVDVKLLFSF